MTAPQVLRFDFKAMACACEVLIGVTDQDDAWARQCAANAIREVLRIEAKYSRYRPDSVVSVINAAAGIKPVSLDEETRRLLAFADRMHKHSKGLFDITSGVYRRVWDFSQARCPSEYALAQVRERVGWDKVLLEEDRVFLQRRGMEIDFGGMGKEYAADRAAGVLREGGVRHALVNLGGDLASVGPRPDEQPWQAGIRHPRQNGQIMATLALSGQGLATSGDYERYFELDGQRYCHIIDPFTGWPVRHFMSVSVVAPSCLLAGVLSTSIMLGQERAQDWIETLGFPVLWMDANGQLGMQPGS